MMFISIFFMGLQLGATACAISCMPVMSPILLANGEDRSRTMKILVQFFGAKVVAYTLIAVLAFFGAGLVKSMIENSFFSQILGAFIILLGSWLFFTALRAKKSCIKGCTNSKISTLGYLGIGFFSSFSFCAPLMSLVLLSSITTNFNTSLLYGISFGLGVVLIPFLFFYLFIFKISSSIAVQLAKYKKHIEIFASLLLIIIGFLVYYQHLKL
ncbi:hypothetical protein M947_03115 [Sulfurimonas hongkongensis]|uniref:Urease accessory protein UreH-like transmembrane domain-containing protein n=1 Tax=Sulfurimonas hongkongensis TaxID=1172190 RepID=T0L2H3_9BACT|nr:sulfite exporter TauE/SafE family protein [Sulfurimonas hongkongensis]EQB40028.1 hypothetical protein M947_03115 [Sulfurimonas hongkongensis]